MAHTPSIAKTVGRLSIKWKLTVVLTILMIGMVAILTIIQISSQKQLLAEELDKRILLMKENLVERGKSYMSNLILHLEKDIAAYNYTRAMEVVKESVENNNEIRSAILMNSEGIALVHTQYPALVQKKLSEQRDLQALTQARIKITEYTDSDGHIIEIVGPLRISTAPWGVVRLFYSLSHLDHEIEISRRAIKQESVRIIYHSIFTSIGFLGICFIIVYIMSTKFLTPLIHLTNSARSLAKGDFSATSNIQINSSDEVGVLASTFVQMSEDIKDSYEQLSNYSKILAQKVKERTSELNQKNIKLTESIKEIEQAAIDKTRLAEETQRALQEAQAKEQEIVRINQVVQAVNSTLNIDEVMTSVRDALQVIFNFDQIGIALLGESKKEFEDNKFYGKALTQEMIDQIVNIRLPMEHNQSYLLE
ncbi:HAMP domain-containing protein, partial [candidate division CSSED10-310 bacterium]